MDSTNRELVQQLLDDVAILDTQFIGGLPKPSAARAIFAPILRRWIGEGLFFKAQKLILPHTIEFMIVSNRHTRDLCKAGVYEHWMELMAFGGVSVSVMQVAKRHLGSDGKLKTRFEEGVVPKPTPQKAKIFFEQRVFFWKGEFYTREDVIKMLANALGGVHFDFRRADDKAHIDEIKNYFGFEVKGNNSQMLVGNDIGQGRADPARRPYIYDATELVTMDTAHTFAQGIRTSEDLFSGLVAP